MGSDSCHENTAAPDSRPVQPGSDRTHSCPAARRRHWDAALRDLTHILYDKTATHVYKQTAGKKKKQICDDFQLLDYQIFFIILCSKMMKILAVLVVYVNLT